MSIWWRTVDVNEISSVIIEVGTVGDEHIGSLMDVWQDEANREESAVGGTDTDINGIGDEWDCQ